MAFILSDRVKETTTTTGTGTVTLGGTIDASKTFSAAIGDGNSTYYCIESPDGNFEVGIGTYTSSSNTLSRDTVISSTNGGSKISLVGVSNVFCTQPGPKAVFINSVGLVSGVNSSFEGFAFPDGTIQYTSATSGNAPTTMQRQNEGILFNYFVNNAYDETVSLHLENEQFPRFKLGLRDSPDGNSAPTYGYLFGEQGYAGGVADSTSEFFIANNNGFWIKHASQNIANFAQDDGIVFQNVSAASPAFTVKGNAAQAADLQRWSDNASTTLAKVTKEGHISGVQIHTPHILFADGTTQVSAAAVASGDNISIFANDAGYLTSHPSISAASSSNNSNNVFIQDITLDSNGHVTAIGTASAFEDWNINSDDGVPYAITNGNTLQIVGGTNVTTTYNNSTKVLTVNATDTNTTYTAGDGLTLFGTEFSAPDIATASGALRTTITSNTAAIPASGYTISGVLQPQISSNTTAIPASGYVISGVLQPQITSNVSNISTNTTAIPASGYHISGVLQSQIDGLSVGSDSFTSESGVAHSGFFSEELHNISGVGGLIANKSNWDTAYGWGNHASAGYLTSYTETNNLSSAVTWANVPNANITESSVTQHQAALSITESQISDFGSYLTSQTSHADVVVDGDFGSEGLMKRGGSAGSYSIVTDNSSNWNTAYGWGDHSSAGYLTAHPNITEASSNLDNSGRTYIQDITLDSNGHVTAVGVATETVTDTTYSAGNGLALSSTTFSIADPATLTELTESNDDPSDKILLWDEDVSTWKYMTLDNLQDSIDTTGGGGGGGSVTTVKANGSQVGGADIVTLDFSSDFTVAETPDTEINISITKGISDGNFLTANNAVEDDDFLRINGTEVEGLTAAEVRTALNVEDGADVTDATNVTAAGALMDSELTDLAGVKGVTISTLQVKPSEGAFADGDKTKLDSIAASANNYTLPSASTTAVGGVELATTGETTDGTDTTRAVTPAGVQAAIDALVDSAPGTLNTLNELAAAIGDDANYASTITTALAAKAPIASPTFTGTVAIPNIADLESAVTANTAKVTNVSTNLGVTTSTTTVIVTSSDGTNATIPVATTSIGGVMSKALFDKLDGIEASADVTDATNVTAAGALMDSEVTNLAQVKAFDSSDYATAAQGTKADSAQQPPTEGAFVNGDKTKLDGIEANADVTDTANVTSAGALMDSELTDLAGVKGVTISTLQVKPSEGAFADGDKTKLDAIEASADVTDTTNVTAAGALMDSEVTNLAFVKGLTKGISDGNVLTANDAVEDDDFLRINGTEVEGLTAAEVRTALNVADGATANAGDITSVVAGDGLTGGATTGDATLNVVGGDGITANANDVAITAAQTTITSVYNASLKMGRDSENLIDFATTDNKIILRANNVDQVSLIDNVFGPEADSDVDLGTTSKRWKDAYVDSLTTTDKITIGGSINQAPNTATDGGAIDIDCGASNYHEITLNANASSIVFTNVTAGQRIIVRFKQHSSHVDLDSNDGFDTVTVNGSAATVTWPGGTIPTLTETNDAVDVYGFLFQDTVTNVHAFIIGQNLS